MPEIYVTKRDGQVELAKIKDEIYSFPKLFKCNNMINTMLLRDNTIFTNSKLANKIHLTITENISLNDKIKLILMGLNSLPKCLCGNTIMFNRSKLNKYCSKKCANSNIDKLNKAIQTNLKKYGVSHYVNQSKSKQTNLERYGGHPMTTEIKSLVKQTKLKRYGDENYNNREKAKATSLLLYGDENYNNREKAKATNSLKFGVTSFSQTNYSAETKKILFDKDRFIKCIKSKTRREVAKILNVNFSTVCEYILKYNVHHLIKNKESILEIELSKYLNELNIYYIHNSRSIIPPLELDFYLPEYNVAIELNGNYWHSEIAGKKDKNYHFNKWKLCKDKGIDLHSYFEDELIDNFDVIKSKIRYITNKNYCVIGARKCVIHNITYKEEQEFLNEYHIQGESKARNKAIGSCYKGNLVAVFSWQKKKHYLEITRFACDSKASYPGLFSKFEKYMIKELNYTGDIVSFSNNGHSNGNVYKASGFIQQEILGPAYWYTKDYYLRENRQKYMKQKIKKKFDLSQEYIDSHTEWQLMQELGYDRIWDSGKIKWSKFV